MKRIKMMAALPAMALAMTGTPSLVMAADADVNILKNSGSLDRLFKKSGVYNAPAPARRRFRGRSRHGRSRCRTTGCWARSAGSMSTSMTMSGSTTGRARMTNEEAGLEGPVPGANR